MQRVVGVRRRTAVLLLALLQSCAPIASPWELENQLIVKGKAEVLEDAQSLQQFAPTLAANKCVFILATGRSGSTTLMDALNQIPNYLIRGEQWSAIGLLHRGYRRLRSLPHATGQVMFNWHSHRNESFLGVKELYASRATAHKLPFFTEFLEDRVMLASRVFYSIVFGHFGDDVVSGFKEIRYVCGRYLGPPHECPTLFGDFVGFLRRLCVDVKLLFNSRRSASLMYNQKLMEMDDRIRDGGRAFAQLLSMTHDLYDKYASGNPDHAMRVYLEDMFDPQRNASLVSELLRFLGEDPDTKISFARMPAWNPG